MARLIGPACLLCVLLLAHCGQDNRCGPLEGTCGSSTACVAIDRRGTVCQPRCQSHSDCPQDEACLSRLEYTPNTELLYADVCFPRELLESSESEADQTACRLRELDVCERNPACLLGYASKLDLEQQCGERMPVTCLGPLILCEPSFTLGTDPTSELFVFSSWCDPESFSQVVVGPGDPLYPDLFGVEPNVWEWPSCI